MAEYRTKRLREAVKNVGLLVFLLSLIPVAYVAATIGSVLDWLDYPNDVDEGEKE